MAASSSSSSQVKYDVFISFRREDIRSGFLSHLKKELRRKQVDFYVDERLERGDEISSTLNEAIEGSMIALVIFSKHYASSKSCLQELVKIMERKEAKQQIVIPVFYCVDPSDVRYQKGTYAESFNDHEQRFKDNMDTLKIWRSVLKKAADLSASHSSNFQNESDLIDAIVQDVLKKSEDNYTIAPKSQLVGFHQNLANVESLMKITSQEVIVIGIWGVGGIGKTTLARATFDNFSSQFESCCFIENVREESTRINGLSYLRQKLLSKLLDQDEDVHIDMNDARRRLSRKKVLIVLDDVSNSKQLNDLAGQQLYLGPGSRVIVTSRDKHVFRSGGIHDEYIHEVKELNFEESLKLFSLHAFNQTHPNMGYERLSEMTVVYAKGIPLALEVLGSHFHSRCMAYWESELEKLRKCLHPEIQNILKVSYDELDDMDKEIFLDIAFFFIGEGKNHITQVLEACGFKAVSGIQNLTDKGLIKTNHYGGIVMPDLILKMAEQIVREECKKYPGRRSRLKDVDEIHDVLKSNMETNKIQGIILDLDRIKHLVLDADTFTKMKNLRFLKIFHPRPWMTECKTYHHIELPFGLGSFPNEIRYFYWEQYPLESLPLGFYAKNLVELHIKDSNIKKLWDGVQDLVNLKTLDLSRCKQLVELPDFSMTRNLESVNIWGCESLHSVHPSILSLQSLVRLTVSHCRELESLESETHLESLSYLNVEDCQSLKKFCLSSKKLGSLSFCGTEVEILHVLPMGGFTELKTLFIGNGERLRRLPTHELCGLTNLEKFEIYNFQQVIHTTELRSLFDAWRNLEQLLLKRCSYLLEIPDNIKALTSLKRISLRECERLKSILGLPPFLEELNAGGCTSLEIVFSDSLVQNQCRFDFEECIKLDECSLRFIEKLTHFSLTSAREAMWLRLWFGHVTHVWACYAGSTVPKWMEYKHQTEASNAIEFICNLERSPIILCCCVVPPHLYLPFVREIYCDFSYDDSNKLRSSAAYYSKHKMTSVHVYIWHMELKGVSFGAGTGNVANISCEFYADYFNGDFDDPGWVEKVPVKACGVHVTYNSESDSDEERLPPTNLMTTSPVTPCN